MKKRALILSILFVLFAHSILIAGESIKYSPRFSLTIGPQISHSNNKLYSADYLSLNVAVEIHPLRFEIKDILAISLPLNFSYHSLSILNNSTFLDEHIDFKSGICLDKDISRKFKIFFDVLVGYQYYPRLRSGGDCFETGFGALYYLNSKNLLGLRPSFLINNSYFSFSFNIIYSFFL